ncbi:ROK family transcriptional regulator [Cytobacillus firmus]|jgi:glucokinase-like ROK family protein|uniref:ROK family transcriptional regulator n=1 Tax=Cytobacillus firmus TaxID=1399 RepID=A0AA46SF61_CYTFI|nr:ROK family transcriptional regulator [Cytobacillus firmus]MCS0653136.1 ROK family transcriptional regulator [Cytobacillus firmus]MCU1806107.1 ROK family transcriptional regulator [Cytobacillus firmus]UYG95616.1 ROK family transcriptional regulator [Cytobacillus firmus]WHY32035.1 ROK family transcriptional regulator [Cytobacillus firmus]
MTWNQQLVKMKNKSRVLQTIIDHSPISRADIAQYLGLTKGTVSSLVNELIEEKICSETGPGKSSGGRRPVMLLFNEQAGYAIGIDLGVNYILGVMTDLSGNIVSENLKHMNSMRYEETVLVIKEIIQSLLDFTPESPYGVIGIGIGVPGIVNKEGSNILLAPNLGWTDINLKAEIVAEFHLPVIIDNEANAGAYGEKRFGAGKNFENLIYVSAGIGIGVGFILQNSLYRGAEGFSGEMGHMVIDLDGKECRCGSKGCWELYASEQALLNQAKNSQSTSKRDDLNLESLVVMAEEDEEVKDLFRQIGRSLGIGINNIINTFNPEQIIIGNRLAIAKELLQESIMEVVVNRSLRFNQQNLNITFADLSIYSTALGASAYATENFLNSDLQENLNK